MKRTIVLLLTLTFSFFAFSQGRTIDIALRDVSCFSDSISLKLVIKNISSEPYTIYKPGVCDICSSILKIKLIDTLNNCTYEIFPCSSIIDLNEVVINCLNSIYLEPNDIFIRTFKFDVNDISPHLRRNKCYKVFWELNLSSVKFEPDTKNLLKDDFKSNRIDLFY